MMVNVNRAVLDLAHRIAAELMRQGAQAVMVIGSHVRGDDHTESDIDIVAIGNGAPYRLDRQSGYLVSISWQTTDAIENGLRDPSKAAGLVSDLRAAILLDDPHGIAARLQQAARDWTWGSVRQAAQEYVAEQVTGWAEEVHKLAACLDFGRQTSGAVQRSLLAIYLAPLLALHREILYDTENQLWDLVNQAMGSPWAETQARAFGLNGETYLESCRAALTLYVIAAHHVYPLLDLRQRGVVDHACTLAQRVITGSDATPLSDTPPPSPAPDRSPQ